MMAAAVYIEGAHVPFSYLAYLARRIPNANEFMTMLPESWGFWTDSEHTLPLPHDRLLHQVVVLNWWVPNKMGA
jgi:hypothetical protein